MSTSDSSLYWECVRGDKPLVLKLANPDNVNYIDPFVSDTPLHRACKRGWLDVVKILIERYGCDPHVTNKIHQSPLDYAERYGKIEVVSYLQSRIRVNSPLVYWACFQGNKHLVLKLINSDNVNCMHPDISDTLLHQACRHGWLDIVKLLIETYGCDPNVRNKHHESVLHYACLYGHLNIVMLIIEKYGCDPNVTNKSKQSVGLLHYACRYGYIEVVEYLINKQHMNPLLRDSVDQLEPLDCALNNSKTDIAVYLCQHCISSDEMLNPNRIKTTVNLIQYIILLCPTYDVDQSYCQGDIFHITLWLGQWKTTDGDNILQLAVSSKIVISHVPSPVMLKVLNSKYVALEPDCKTSDGDNILELACQSKVFLSQTPSGLILKWLGDATINQVEESISDSKTADGDTLIQLVCQSEICISHTSTAVLTKWLSDTTVDLTTIITPEWKTADGVTLLQLVCQSKAIISRIYSTALTKWLSNLTNIFDIMKIVTTNWKTADGDTLFIVLSKLLSNISIDQMKMVDPNWKTLDGIHFLYILCQSNVEDAKIIELMQHYILKDGLNVESTLLDSTYTGNTALHIACQVNKLAVVSYLIDQAHCDPNIKNKTGSLPIDMTTNPEVINYLCQQAHVAVYSKTIIKWMKKHWSCSINDATMLHMLNLLVNNDKFKTEDGSTLLHVFCSYVYCLRDNIKFVDFLLTEGHCDPNCLDSNGKMPLQITSNSEIMKTLVEHDAKMTADVVFKLITSSKTDPLINEILTLSIRKQAMLWNPNELNSDGYTALHLACKVNNPTTVDILLSEAQCDPNIKSNRQKVPLQMTTNREIIKDLIRYGAKTSIMYASYQNLLGINKPVQSPVKVFIVGNPSVGKSTLTAALKKNTSIIARIFSGKISGVDRKTVGIVPHDLESDRFGRITLYDFAGHREFYSGHAALLQTAIQSTPPTFLLVINICEEIDEIIKNIFYWISFLENQCASVSCKPHIIFVGSHADALKGISPKDKIKIIVDSLDSKYFTNMEYIGFVAMNCQYHESTGMSDLRCLLIKSINELRIHEPITFNAHCFLVFLIDTFMNLTAVTIKIVLENIEYQQSKEGVLEFLPKNIEALYKICLELNDRGHILLLKDRITVENSYIVIDKEFLLSEISGTVFAPEGFKQYGGISSNTGVVPLSKIIRSFPDKDINVLIGYLTHLEFCHEISDQALLQNISKDYPQVSNERYYLFPGLISLEAEANVWETEFHFNLHFGWILQCTNLTQFLTSRFLQVLLLRLAFSLALESKSDDNDRIGIHRKCSIWKNGIFWGREFGMETLVEVIEDKSVIVMAQFQMSNLEKCIKHRSEVICTVLECLERFCPRVSTTESFIDASSPLRFPFALNSNKMLCTVQDVAQAIVGNCVSPSVVLSDSGKTMPAERFLSFEPYTEIEPFVLQELWDENNVDKIISDSFLSKFVRKSTLSKLTWFTKIFNDSVNIPSNKDDLFQELLKWRGSEMTYKHFRQKLDQYSVFAGRNLLDIAGYKCEVSYVEKDEMQISGKQISKLNVEGSLPNLDIQTLEMIQSHGGRKELICKPSKVLRGMEEEQEQEQEKPQCKLRVYGNKPKLHELQLLNFPDGTELRIMEKVAPQWKQVAIALGFGGTRIQIIEIGALRQPEDASLKMFTDWLEEGHDLKPPTWDTLIQSLRAANVTEMVDFSIEIVAEDASVSTLSTMAVDTESQVVSSTATHDVINGNITRKAESSKCENDVSPNINLNLDSELSGQSQTKQGSSIATMLNIKFLEEIEGHGRRKVRAIESIGSQWEEVAKALDMSQEDIDVIKTRHSHNDEEACREMLATWLEGNNGEVSWTAFSQVLIDAGLPELADSLKDILVS